MAKRVQRHPMTVDPATARPDQALLLAATRFAQAAEISEILGAITAAVGDLEDIQFSGLGVYEDRRRVLVIYTTPNRPGGDTDGGWSRDGEEFLLHDTEAARFLEEPHTYTSPDLDRDRSLAVHERFRQMGIHRYVAVPLLCGDHFLGTLYAASHAAAAPSRAVVAWLEHLAVLLAPALWNLMTQTRLAKGDRRRATLIELSRAINTSLKLDAVLQAAHQAIGRIEGHCLSMVGLLDDDQQTLRAHWHPVANPNGGPELIPVAETALSWVLEQRKTYESETLSTPPFRIDARMADAGVRRYVVAPMFVRGRIIGGFLFGTSDPHPALTTDVWLYENIALQLALAIDNAIQFEQLRALSDRLAEQNVYLREEIETDLNVEGMIGDSPAMQRVCAEIGRVASTDATVLIMGPTGVGKELVARALHAGSERGDHPLVKINCAAIPENLVESELFGHERGAFTSAVARRIGRFELARDGTLFLDEIGELPLPIQAKLLRVLQDGEFERVGGTTTITTNARIIAATNRDLLRASELGTFRSDLYYRLNVFPLVVPPLSERIDDIPLLVASFIGQFSRRMGRTVERIDPASLDYLCHRDWPGNVRELRHVIERAMILSDGPVLTVEPSAARRTADPGATQSPAVPAPLTVPPPPPLPTAGTAVGTLEDMERQHIRQALRQTGGVIDGARGAAALLGLNPSTLRSRMKRLGIRRMESQDG